MGVAVKSIAMWVVISRKLCLSCWPHACSFPIIIIKWTIIWAWLFLLFFCGCLLVVLAQGRAQFFLIAFTLACIVRRMSLPVVCWVSSCLLCIASFSWTCLLTLWSAIRWAVSYWQPWALLNICFSVAFEWCPKLYAFQYLNSVITLVLLHWQDFIKVCHRNVESADYWYVLFFFSFSLESKRYQTWLYHQNPSTWSISCVVCYIEQLITLVCCNVCSNIGKPSGMVFWTSSKSCCPPTQLLLLFLLRVVMCAQLLCTWSRYGLYSLPWCTQRAATQHWRALSPYVLIWATDCSLIWNICLK